MFLKPKAASHQNASSQAGRGRPKTTGILCHFFTLAGAPVNKRFLAFQAFSLTFLCFLSTVTCAQDTLRINGLRAPVEICRDRWGIAHIYAQNEEDLFFAQGYNAASDRLFQLEIWRRQATGTMAELLGERELKRDMGARLFKFRGNIEQELNHYHPRGSRIVRSFVKGVNAYIDEIMKTPEQLPIEFKLLQTTPQRWTPEVVVSRHQGLLSNVEDELMYGRLLRLIGAEKLKDLIYFHPGTPDIQLKAGVAEADLFQDILELYKAFRRPVKFVKEDVRTGYLDEEKDDSRFEGSNNWVLSGQRTQSGFPILANDPHRAHATPALRYWCHLNAPGWNVIGGGEPAIPGISIGHNDYGAWGLTIFETDNEDLYIYEINPRNPNQYRYKGVWETMRVRADTIKVLGKAPQIVQLKYTRHGPVVFEDASKGKLYAVRAGWLEIGCSPYLASLRMGQAKSWPEFRQACRFSRIPGENMVWADRSGHIGWQAVGISPIRPNWSGLVPVPGDGSHEWAGYLDIEKLPHRSDPPEGYLITANNNLTPPDFPYRNAIGWEWAAPFRAHRIEEALASGRRHTLVDMMRLQSDYQSLPARQLTHLLKGLAANGESEKARQALLNWDHNLHPESVAAAIYVEWENAMEQALLRMLVPETAKTYIKSLSNKKMTDWLTTGRPEMGENPVDGRNRLLLNALDTAVANLKKRLGDDMAQWQYGQLKNKHIMIRHPLSEWVSPALRAQMDVGPAPRGGSGETVNNTGGNLNQTHGASFRIIADTEDWDRSLGTNSPGQSGNPNSPHYKDLFDMWSKDQYFPVFFSREKVRAVTEKTSVLKPSNR